MVYDFSDHVNIFFIHVNLYFVHVTLYRGKMFIDINVVEFWIYDSIWTLSAFPRVLHELITHSVDIVRVVHALRGIHTVRVFKGL
jgi:hypothetical protein